MRVIVATVLILGSIPAAAATPFRLRILFCALLGGIAEELGHALFIVTKRRSELQTRLTMVGCVPIAFSIEIPRSIGRQRAIATLVGGPLIVILWCATVGVIVQVVGLPPNIDPLAVAFGSLVSITSLLPFHVGATHSDMSQVLRVARNEKD